MAADVNGDQNLDLVVACSTSRDAYILLGDGQGRLAAPRIFALGVGPFGLVTADFNGDKKPDLAAPLIGGTSVIVLQNLSQ